MTSNAKSSSGREFAKFWNNSLMASYKKCAYPIVTDSAGSDSNSSSGSSNDRASNSWFSATRAALPNTSTSWRSSVSFPADSTVSKDTLIAPKKRNRLLKSATNSERAETHTRKIRMRLTKEQKQKICSWMRHASPTTSVWRR